MLGERIGRAGIVTSSRIALGIVTAIRWLNRDIKAFPPTRWSEALSFVGVDTPEQRSQIMEWMRDHALELGFADALKLRDRQDWAS